jgi:hypothetical protein
VVIDNLNISSLTGFPAKDDSPLVINSETVLSLPVSGELFQPVSWRYPKVFNHIRTIEKIKFPLGQLLKLQGKPLDPLSLKNPFCVPVSKGLYHEDIITLHVNNDKRYW